MFDTHQSMGNWLRQRAISCKEPLYNKAADMLEEPTVKELVDSCKALMQEDGSGEIINYTIYKHSEPALKMDRSNRKIEPLLLFWGSNYGAMLCGMRYRIGNMAIDKAILTQPDAQPAQPAVQLDPQSNKGVKYGGPDMWAILHPDIQCVCKSKSDAIHGCNLQPKLESTVWRAVGCTWWTLTGLLLTDVPEDWTKSLVVRPVVWRAPNKDTKIDTKVWVRNSQHTQWYARYYAGNNTAFSEGGTSWSSRGTITHWCFIVVVDPNRPNEQPPMDYLPDAAPTDSHKA